MRDYLTWFFRAKTPGAHHARTIAKLVLLAVLFAFLFTLVPLEQVIQAMLTADLGYFTLGVIAAFVGIVLTAVQMEPLTRNQGIQHGIGSILAINLAVKFYLQFTPGTIIASGIRWYRLAQPGGKVVESLVALTFFRVLETFLTLTMGLAFFLLAEQQADIEISLGWLVVILLGIALTWVLVTRYSLAIYHWFQSRYPGLLGRDSLKGVSRRVDKFLVAVSAYSRLPASDLALSIGAGILSALAGIASGVLLAKSLGIDLDFLNMGWIQAFLIFATQLPFSVAGGLGIREVSLIALLSSFGVSPELAMALSFLMFIRGVVLSILGGILEGIRIIRSPKTTDIQQSSIERKEL